MPWPPPWPCLALPEAFESARARDPWTGVGVGAGQAGISSCEQAIRHFARLIEPGLCPLHNLPSYNATLHYPGPKINPLNHTDQCHDCLHFWKNRIGYYIVSSISY